MMKKKKKVFVDVVETGFALNHVDSLGKTQEVLILLDFILDNLTCISHDDNINKRRLPIGPDVHFSPFCNNSEI